jgi:hypothetical protein
LWATPSRCFTLPTTGHKNDVFLASSIYASVEIDPPEFYFCIELEARLIRTTFQSYTAGMF